MMQPWFLDAKLGIFVHYGIYAVDGVAESWSMFQGRVEKGAYYAQAERFTASEYDPDAWCELFARVGAKYAVLTTKHHDGIALWDSDINPNTVVRRTPAGRDLIAPYVEACRRHGLKVGFYYSHLDWSHPDYATVRPTRKTHHMDSPGYDPLGMAFPPEGSENPEAWARFLRFHRAELEELSTRFGPIDIFWFDGEWERDPEQFDMAGLRRQLEAWQPTAIFNARLLDHGDYATPEQGVPIVPPEGPWEFCVTLNDSWGFQHGDTNWKSADRVVRMLAETIGMGGNMLLDVGPREDGTIPDEARERLEALGAWISAHESAVYGTRAGLPAGLHYGASTLSVDRQTLNLFLFDRPRGEIAVKGLATPPTGARHLATGTPLLIQAIGGLDDAPPVYWITLPEALIEPHATVVALDFDRPLDVYVGSGRL